MYLTDLKEIVERVMETDLMDQSRNRANVDAKRIFAVIAVRKLNYSKVDTGVFLKKHHATIVHYFKNFDYLINSEINLYKSYMECLNAVMKNKNNNEQLIPHYKYHLRKAREYAKLVHD